MAAIRRMLAVLLLAVVGLGVTATAAQAVNPPVRAQYCDTRDPSLARQETFPTGPLLINNRRLVLRELYRTTGSTIYLETVRRLADAAPASPLVQGGVLTESCDQPGQSCDDNQRQFKGIFMGHLTAAGQRYRSCADTRATTLCNGRDTLNRTRSRWVQSSSAPPGRRTQASALSALLAAS